MNPLAQWDTWDIANRFVLGYLDSVPTIAASQALRDAANEFCRETTWLRYRASIPVVDGQTDYTIDLTSPSGQLPSPAIISPHQVKIADVPYYSVSEREAYDRQVGLIYRYEFLLPNTMRFLQPPPAGETIDVTVSITGANEYGVSSVLLDRWGEAIGYGARARLHSQAMKPYTDSQRARQLQREYRAQIDRARREVNRGYGFRPLRATAPKWM